MAVLRPTDVPGVWQFSSSVSSLDKWSIFLVLSLKSAAFAAIQCALMAKALTKSQIAATIGEQVGMTKKQAVQVLDLVAELAYKQAKNTFTLPGIGKLVLVNRPARTMTMQFGPKKGQTIKVPARRAVKFRVAKAAKDAILGAKK
jgi:DNA-binding protein HU-beta